MRFAAAFLAAPLLLVACAPNPDEMFSAAMQAAAPTQDVIDARPRQTETFQGVSEQRLKEAMARTLREMGFNIDTSAPRLGLMTASRESTGTDLGPLAGQMVLAVLLGPAVTVRGVVGTQSFINLRVTVVTMNAPDGLTSRAAFERLTLGPTGVTTVETLVSDEFTTQFFARVRQALAA